MDLGTVRKIDIDSEMQQAYLDYAMSVIVARALPDARDGLKPVQRRILYAMYDMGIRADSPYKKSARIVGEVLGKYHPHGDAAVYDAMARMAQDFSLRTMLVDGQGNFGSVDGDPPAAMRYTEARLAAPAVDILADLNKNTVDFTSNFDDTLAEPSVLPSAIPNLLVNGATGIAVGMATSIPPHNLGEVVDALVYMLNHWADLDDIDVDTLMDFVQGPDFPTGGVIFQEEGAEGLEAAYGSGRGRITVQAQAHTEEMERGRSRIIITELPYTVNKSSLIERIAELAREGHLEGLADLRDESDRHGMRIVIELTKNAQPEAVLHELFRRTPMQITFGINLLALVDGEPRTLTLKQALRVYLEHRLNVIRRRAEFDLDKARQRAHILQGLLVALQHLDEVISLIRNASDVDAARLRLMKRFKLTELQANAILDMQLRRLAALERRKIETEFKETTAVIKDLEALLKSPKRMRAVVADELSKVKEAYGDRRRTQIVSLKKGAKAAKTPPRAELIPQQMVWVGVTADGVAARTPDEKPPRPSGHDGPRWLVKASTADTIYFVSKLGKAAAVSVQLIPQSEKLSGGSPYNKVSPLTDTDTLAVVFALPARRSDYAEGSCLVCATRYGMVKKTLVSDLPGPSAQAFTLLKVNEGDVLVSVALTDGKKKEIVLTSAEGMAIRFGEDSVRPMGLVAAGVSGMKLADKDEVIAMDILPADGELFLLSSDGRAKRLELDELPAQGRYGKGVRVWNLPDKVKLVGASVEKSTHTATLHLSKGASRSTRLDAAGLRKRASSKGDPVAELKPGEDLTAMTLGWSVERFLPKSAEEKKKPSTAKKPAKRAASKKTAPRKQAAKKTVAKHAPRKPARRPKPRKS